MDVQSAFASTIVCAVACTLGSACATPPKPMPPRRVVFADAPVVPLQPAQDLGRPAEPPIIHERYAHWMLAADAASLVPLTAWMLGRSEDVYLAMPSLLLPPIIHLAHGESETALISLALRGLMVGGVYLAGRSAEAECADTDEFICIPFGSILLAEIAIVSVVTVDAVFLARRTRREDSWYGLPVQPSVAVTPDGHKWLSLSGRF